MKPKLTYNIIGDKVTISPGLNNEVVSVMTSDVFLSLCFDNNWEGAGYQIRMARNAMDKAVWDGFSESKDKEVTV